MPYQIANENPSLDGVDGFQTSSLEKLFVIRHRPLQELLGHVDVLCAYVVGEPFSSFRTRKISMCTGEIREMIANEL